MGTVFFYFESKGEGSVYFLVMYKTQQLALKKGFCNQPTRENEVWWIKMEKHVAL